MIRLATIVWLCICTAASAQALITPPTLIAPKKPPITNYLFATAIRGTNESDPSNEVSTTNRQFALEWNYQADELAAIDGFRMYYGYKSNPTNFIFVGRQLTINWPYNPPRTNFVTIFGPAFALCLTNPPRQKFHRAMIQSASSLLGPWSNECQITISIGERSQ